MHVQKGRSLGLHINKFPLDIWKLTWLCSPGLTHPSICRGVRKISFTFTILICPWLYLEIHPLNSGMLSGNYPG